MCAHAKSLEEQSASKNGVETDRLSSVPSRVYIFLYLYQAKRKARKARFRVVNGRENDVSTDVANFRLING